jgi:hypothetical protein
VAEIVRQHTYVEDLPEQTDSRPERGGKFGLIFLCLTLSAIATIPFYFFGRPQSGPKQWNLQMPITHDMHLHLEQMKSFYNGLAAGEIYPRWEEDTNRGFGAPTTSYYPPGIYYITSAFYALVGDWMVTLLATHLLLMMAAALSFLFYIRQFVSNKAAALATLSYIFLPYHLLDQYQRGAMAELLGFIWMPLMLLFGERLFRRADVEDAGDKAVAGSAVFLNIAGLAASYGAFLWSHPPTAYQFSLAFGLYTLILAGLRRDWRALVFVGCAIALGAMLSAAYLYPAAAEQDFIRHEYVSDTWPYHATYIFVHHLPYSSSGAGGFFRMLDSIWIFGALVMIASAALFFAVRRRRLSALLKERFILWLVTGCFASFMMLKYSEPIGRQIPKIDIGVFTWRMLSITTLVTALLAGFCAHLAADKINQEKFKRVISGALAAIISIGGIIFSIVAVARPMVLAPNFIPSTEHVNYAMIPHDAMEEPLEMPHLRPAFLIKGKGEVTVEKWLPESRALRAVVKEDDTLFIRTFNFPGWTATINGEPATLKTGAVLKEINLDLPAGEYRIQLQYLDTPIRQRGEGATKTAFFLFMGILVMGFAGRAFPLKRFSNRLSRP